MGRPLAVRVIRPVSKRRAAQRPERIELVERVLTRDRHACTARTLVWDVRCAGPLDVHEIIPKSAWRDGYLVDSNCVTVCRAHHRWIDNRPDEAHALGLHGFSWERPA